MGQLITKPNIETPDAFYSDLIKLHEGLTDDESEALNAKLILVLSNHIGDTKVLREAFELCKG
ncbi:MULTISPECIES: DUF2783 domain-containing protein [unclassified Ruegeria]|uniref:DUF2783 domain-containing protein n=1 Tax=unclassified Ruegeria TaxID=2625375 RepID=UPI0014883206|nr:MULTISPECIES: DUF2783 domain-containing protein [unclassified Ruegeria]